MKQQQVKEVAYLGKRVYFGNKPYTLVENEVKGMCQGCDLYLNPIRRAIGSLILLPILLLC